jgi:hypothetical protein
VQTEAALEYWSDHAPEWVKYMPDRASVRRFLKLLGYSRVIEAMDIALSRHSNSPHRYVFGVLHNWRRQKEEQSGEA